MIQSLRVLVAVGVMVFMAAGCQKGTQSGAKENGGAKDVGSNGTEAPANAEKSSAQGSDAAGGGAQGTDAAAGGSQGTDAAAGGSQGTDAAAGGASVGGRGHTLTVADDGSIVDLRLGQTLTVVLGSNRSAGLSWAMAEPTETVIVLRGKPVYASTTGKAGTDGYTGTETWRFLAAQKGRQTVRLEYRREWQRDVPERTFRFTANVR